MKRRTRAISFLLVLAMILGLVPVPFGTDRQVLTAEAANTPLSGKCGSITWKLTKDTEVEWDLNEGTPYKLTFTGKGKLEFIDAPWSANQETITSITIGQGITELEGWFDSYPSLKSVTLPQSLTEIPNGAFAYASLLETVTFGDALTTIGMGAFRECHSLESITFPDSLTTIDDYAFYNCSGLRSVIFGEGLRVIGKSAFDGDNKLAQVEFKEGLEIIGERAFALCHKLSSVSLPDSVTTLQSYAFVNAGLGSFTVPKNVTSIEAGILLYAYNLRTIQVADGNANFLVEDGILYEKGVSGAPYRAVAYSIASSAATVSIADGTEIIDSYAFCAATNITTVSFPNTLRQINKQAFKSCQQITELSIPDSVESIGEEAFSECTSMTKADIGIGLREFGAGVFLSCNALETINIAEENRYLDVVDNIIYDKGHTHLYFYALTKPDVAYHVPDTIESMSSYAICNVTALKELYMPKGLKSIPNYAIWYNESLDSIYFPGDAPCFEQKRSIDSNAYDLIIFRMPSSSGWDAGYWKSFKYADWDPENTMVEEGTIGGISWKYKGDEGRLSFTGSGELPDFTSETPAPWSEYMASIQTVGAASISGIGDSSFYQAEKLLRLETSEEMKRIGNHAFASCKKLCLLDLSAIETIGTGAFENNVSLADSIVMMKVLSIGSGAFKGCTAIPDVTFGVFLTSLEEKVFAGCTALHNVIVPDSVAAIKDGAFKDCVSLRTINIPAKVNEIGSGAFLGDTSLEKVYFYGRIPERWEDDSFIGCNDNLTIYYRKSQTVWEQLGGAWNGIPVQGQDKFYTERQNHYSFSNASGSFGYGADYRIPRQRYVDVMKNITTGSYYYAINKGWDGSCYGMTGSTLEFYENPEFKVADYDASAQNLYNIAAPKDKNAPLTKLIEAYQISQYKPLISACSGCINRNMGDYKSLIQKVEEFERSGGLSVDSKAEPVVMAIYSLYSGHAVVPVSVDQDNDGNFVMKIYDPNFPSSLKTLIIRKDLRGISYGMYMWASYIPYSSVAEAMAGVQLYSNTGDDSLYLSVDKEKGSVTDLQGKGLEEIEGAYEQKPFNDAEEDVFSGIKSFVLPKGNYDLTAKTDNEDAKKVEDDEEPVTFYVASEENFAIISSSDEDAVLEVREVDTENDELEIELRSESGEEEAASLTIMNELGMERAVEVEGANATVKVAEDDTITIVVPAGEKVSIDGKEAEINDGQVVTSFVAALGETPLKMEDLETSVDCDANNKLSGTVNATVISNALSTKNVTVTADYYEADSGKKAATYSKKVQLDAGMNLVSISFEDVETDFSKTEGQMPMICNLTVSDEEGNSAVSAVEGITVTLTKKTDPTDPEVAVERVIVLPEELTLTVGESSQLNASVLPANATDKKLVYIALNDNVTVTKDGKVTANKVGSSRIMVKSSNGKYAVVTVTVTKKTDPADPTDPTKPTDPTDPTKPTDPGDKDIAVTGVSVTPKKGTFGVGESFRLEASVVPANATDKTLTYIASNDNVIVTPEGVVTAKKAGNVRIMVKASNGQYAVTDVVVKKAPNKVTLNAQKKNLKVGKTFQIKVKLPENTASSRISYSSSKKSVADVSSSGKVTAKKKGTAVITVKTYNGKQARLKVTVTKDIPVKKLTVKKKKLTLKVGDAVPLKVSVLPKNATDKRLIYKASNNKVKVTTKGYVIAKKAGKSKITVKSLNGKKVVVNVTVKKDQSHFTFFI